MSSSSGTDLPLEIQVMTGRKYKVTAKTDWTVAMLKEEFKKWHGPEADRCSLYYRAKRLNDRETLTKYNIEANAIIMANMRSTGGIPKSQLIIFTQTSQLN